MRAMLMDLVNHQAHADAAIFKAVRGHEAAAADPELRSLLHHILLAHRFWLHLILGLPFAVAEESKIPESLDEIAARYRETQAREKEWLATLQESDLSRMLESPYFPDRRVAVSQGVMQVCMHSQGHRSHAAARLRSLGGEPPPTDFIFWLKDRPSPVWE
jgi:uncharacterized damage-inducible protein DinB